MRYHIDTIPVWDAVKQGGECPLCSLRRKIELTDVERFLGASVMDPEARVRVNEKGFCARHHALLYAQKNRLGHALMTHTHLKETMARLAPALRQAREAGESAAQDKSPRRLLKKETGREGLRAAAARVQELTQSCILCDSIQENLHRYALGFLKLYETDAAFRAAFAASKGVCLPHLGMLLELAAEEMSGPALGGFAADLTNAVERNLTKLEKDIEGFTLKFDYRNADKPWGDSRGALERAVNQLRGWSLGEEPNPK